MRLTNLKFAAAAAASIALAACSDSGSNPDNEAATAKRPPMSIETAPGQVAVCKFTVLPNSDPNDSQGIDFNTATSATIRVTDQNGAQIGGDSVATWPTDNCRLYTFPSGTTQLNVRETPGAGSALYFYRVIKNGSYDPFFVVVGPTTTPTTVTINGVTNTGEYEVYFKNVPYEEPPPPPPGGQGCTPGFWKNSTGSWGPTGYTTGQSFETIFGVPSAFSGAGPTLLQALGLNGGGINALARHATAGLLAAAHPNVNYAYTEAQIIAAVQAAVAGGSTAIEAQKNLFAAENEKGCPLANDNSFRD